MTSHLISIPPGFRLCGLEETGKGFRAYLKRRHDASGFLHGAVDTTPQGAIDLCLAEFLASEAKWAKQVTAAPSFLAPLGITLDLANLGLKTEKEE